MIHLGLLGYPLGHSLSPKIHAAALRSCGLDGEYSLFSINPADKQSLNDLFSRVRSGDIQGLNVTIPHKQNVMSYLDELTPTAQTVGAVNTIYRCENKLIGDNTDAPGFLEDLNRFLVDRQSLNRQIGKSANRQIGNRPSSIVLGAGGSARAVVYALLNDGWEVTVAARRREQAEELVRQFENVNVIEYSLRAFKPVDVQLIVNTTPVGMVPNTDHSPWYTDLPFPPHAFIYDLVYNPRRTKLVKDALLQDVPSITGLGMLIAQAALSFEIWTGHTPPREVLSEAVNLSTL